jgi:hypothetical protein
MRSTIVGYGLYCAKYIGPQDLASDESGTARFNGERSHNQKPNGKEVNVPNTASAPSARGVHPTLLLTDTTLPATAVLAGRDVQAADAQGGTTSLPSPADTTFGIEEGLPHSVSATLVMGGHTNRNLLTTPPPAPVGGEGPKPTVQAIAPSVPKTTNGTDVNFPNRSPAATVVEVDALPLLTPPPAPVSGESVEPNVEEMEPTPDATIGNEEDLPPLPVRAPFCLEPKRPHDLLLNDIYFEILDRCYKQMEDNGCVGQPDADDPLLALWVRAQQFVPTD